MSNYPVDKKPYFEVLLLEQFKRRPLMTHSRLTIFAGHYGSGKTNIAVNYAIMLKKLHPDKHVILADLDIVNPYFRSVDSEKVLKKAGVEIIASLYANSGLEAPAMPSGILSVFDDKSCLAVLDVGGDDRGAYALGKYADYIRKDDVGILLVCNKFRPLSREPKQALSIKNEIETAANIRFTGIVNNSNLGKQTTPDDIISSDHYINEISKMCELPLVFTCVMRPLINEIQGISDLFALDMYEKEQWSIF